MVAATWWFKGLPAPEVDTAEAIALWFAMTFARDLDFFTSQVESNSLIAVQAINNSPPLSSYFGMAIFYCKYLAGYFSNFKVSHVKRDVNHLAHRLTKHALVNHDVII